jgi:hypothetical protein
MTQLKYQRDAEYSSDKVKGSGTYPIGVATMRGRTSGRRRCSPVVAPS